MEKYVDDFMKSNTSLLHYCEINKVSYRKMYFYIKEHYPNLISRKNVTPRQTHHPKNPQFPNHLQSNVQIFEQQAMYDLIR